MALHFSFGQWHAATNGGMRKGFLPGEGMGELIQLMWGGHLGSSLNEPVFHDRKGEELPFAAYYRVHILPLVEGFEQRRIAQLKALRNRLLIALPVFLILLAMQIAVHLRLGARDGQELVLFAAFMIYGALAFWCWGPIRAYKSAIKGQIFPLIFRYYDGDSPGCYSYSEEGQLPVSELQPSGLIPSYDNAHTEDYVKGSYKGVQMELEEAWLTETRGSGKHRRTVVKFQGIFLRLSMNKRFHGRTVIRKDHGAIGNWFSGKIGNGGLERIALEDPEFEKKFEVFGSDQVEARYLLSTSFMERLLELGRIFASDGLQAAFYNNQLLLMIPSKQNRFETSSIFMPATFEEDIRNILAEMEQIFGIIETLKLYEQTRL